MTKDEALDLALEALEYIHEGANNQGPHTGISWRCVAVKAEPAIKAIKQARALDEMAKNARELGLDYETYAEELEQPVPRQAGMISITVSAPVAYLCENAVGHKYFRWKKPSSTFKPIALYITPPAAQQDIQRLSALVRAQQITIDKLEQALAAPVQSCYCPNCEAMGKELAALKAQPAPVQQPFCFYYVENGEEYFAPKGAYVPDNAQPLYTTAAQRQWVGLSDEDKEFIELTGGKSDVLLAELVEAKLKEKNT